MIIYLKDTISKKSKNSTTLGGFFYRKTKIHIVFFFYKSFVNGPFPLKFYQEKKGGKNVFYPWATIKDGGKLRKIRF